MFKIDLQRFAEGEAENTSNENKQGNNQASIDYSKVLFEADGKLNKEAFKVLQPYLDTEKNKHLDSWQKNNLSKYVEKEKFDLLQNEMSQSLTKAEINTALIREMAGSKYPDLLMKEVNFANISKTDNGIIGLTEEVSRIKTAYPELWGTPAPKDKGGGGTPPNANGGSNVTFTAEKLKTMSQKEIMDNYDAIMKQGTLK